MVLEARLPGSSPSPTTCQLHGLGMGANCPLPQFPCLQNWMEVVMLPPRKGHGDHQGDIPDEVLSPISGLTSVAALIELAIVT